MLVDFIDEIVSLADLEISEQVPLKAVVPSKPKTTTQRSSQDMFGSRYGIQTTNKKMRPSSSRKVEEVVNMEISSGGNDDAKAMPDDDVGDIDVADIETTSDIAGITPRKVVAEPAFRVKLLEIVAKGWPVDSSTAAALERPRRVLTTWCYSAGSHEVWSIRRIALIVLGALCSPSMDTNESLALLQCISLNLSEAKHAQVRKAALVCLRGLIERGNKNVLLQCKADIRKLVFIGSSDSQAEVAETASGLQKLYVGIGQ
jgi:hypothetical protein